MAAFRNFESYNPVSCNVWISVFRKGSAEFWNSLRHPCTQYFTSEPVYKANA